MQIVDAKQEQLIQKALKRKLKQSDLIDMDEDGDGCVCMSYVIPRL